MQTPNFSKLQVLKPKLLDVVDDVLAKDITQLMVPQEKCLMPSQAVKGGAFDIIMTGSLGSTVVTELALMALFGWSARASPPTTEIFDLLSPINGKSMSTNAKELMTFKLPTMVLGRVWKLSDMGQGRLLDEEEFSLGNHFIKVKLEGHKLPTYLLPHLILSSKLRQSDQSVPAPLFMPPSQHLARQRRRSKRITTSRGL